MLNNLLENRFNYIFNLNNRNSKYKEELSGIKITNNLFLKKDINNYNNRNILLNNKNDKLWYNKYYLYIINDNINYLCNYKKLLLKQKIDYENEKNRLIKQEDIYNFIDYEYNSYININYNRDIEIINSKFYYKIKFIDKKIIELNKIIEIGNISNKNEKKILKYNLYNTIEIINLKKRNINDKIKINRNKIINDRWLMNINNMEIDNYNLQMSNYDEEIIYLKEEYKKNILLLENNNNNDIDLLNEQIFKNIIKKNNLKEIKNKILNGLYKNKEGIKRKILLNKIVIDLLTIYKNNNYRLKEKTILKINKLSNKELILLKKKNNIIKFINEEMEYINKKNDFININYYIKTNEVFKKEIINTCKIINIEMDIKYINNLNNIIKYLR